MKYIISLIFIFKVFAQPIVGANQSLDLEKLCSGPKVYIDKIPFTIDDLGFCDALQKMKKEQSTIDSNFVDDITHTLSLIEGFNTNIDSTGCFKESIGKKHFISNLGLQSSMNVERKDIWKIRLYGSHSFTTYMPTYMKMRTSRFNIDINDYQWTERSSRHFFLPKTWMEKGHNPFQLFDEPTNTFTLSIEKNGNEFFLSAFHPKFLQNNQSKLVTGTVDGVAVNSVMDISKPFDGYNQEPGELELGVNQNTHREMIFEIGYGHRFKLLDSKIGSLTYTPSLSVGVSAGQNHSAVIQEGQWWDYDYYDEKFKVQGVGGTVSNRLEYNTPNERIGVFYENRMSLYKQKHGFLDGTQEYDLKFMGNNVGVTFMLYKKKNKIKKGPLL